MSVAHAGKAAAQAAAVLTRFRPRAHGFLFANAFPAGKPVFVVRVPPFRIPVGDASKGLCGGMVFAALDHLRHELAPPADPNAAGLHQYLARRLLASFNLPWTILRLYQWMRRPDTARTAGGYYPEATVPYLTTQKEWPKVRACLLRGDPAPLMVVKARGRDPRDLALNHQVLAVGYDEAPDTGDVTVHLYEPNYPACGPGDEDVALRFNTRAFDGRAVEHSREGPSVRGFFLNRYTPATPPPWADGPK